MVKCYYCDKYKDSMFMNRVVVGMIE